MANSSGQMVDAIEVNGLMENNMAKEHTSLAQAKRNMENGKMEKESDGLEEASKTEFINSIAKNSLLFETLNYNKHT